MHAPLWRDVVEVGVRGEQARVVLGDGGVELRGRRRRVDLALHEQVDDRGVGVSGQPLGEEQVRVHRRHADAGEVDQAVVVNVFGDEEPRACGFGVREDLPIRALCPAEPFRALAGRPEQYLEALPNERWGERTRAHVDDRFSLRGEAPHGLVAARHTADHQEGAGDRLGEDVRVEEDGRHITARRKGLRGGHRAPAPRGRPSSCASTARTPRRGCGCGCRP